jgi:hypothetical protein
VLAGSGIPVGFGGIRDTPIHQEDQCSFVLWLLLPRFRQSALALHQQHQQPDHTRTAPQRTLMVGTTFRRAIRIMCRAKTVTAMATPASRKAPRPALRAVLGGAVVLFGVIAAAPLASADPGVISPQDAEFYRLLTRNDDDGPGLVITNFPLVRAQGLLACQRLDNGLEAIDTVHLLQAEGPYSFDVANSITSAAVVIYCHDHFGF